MTCSSIHTWGVKKEFAFLHSSVSRFRLHPLRWNVQFWLEFSVPLISAVCFSFAFSAVRWTPTDEADKPCNSSPLWECLQGLSRGGGRAIPLGDEGLWQHLPSSACCSVRWCSWSLFWSALFSASSLLSFAVWCRKPQSQRKAELGVAYCGWMCALAFLMDLEAQHWCTL